ncbi:SHOCT domain-containing protein [Kribbella pittospori]|uniref:SHOCT domain-containing protein n=1 Tax=Kribbella pittospori TaxID=722689 RepID=A0A4R0K2T1_9ACTN|nr:SHOCT domain-containing protein [Kribbella pittospori]TCC54283.1 SHOCT domain-containing protein [Kribbella pittospori]
MMHSMGLGAGWIALGFALWALVVATAVGVAVRVINQDHPRPASLPSPLDLLERRLAAGAITHEQFDEARARLREHELDL